MTGSPSRFALLAVAVAATAACAASPATLSPARNPAAQFSADLAPPIVAAPGAPRLTAAEAQLLRGQLPARIAAAEGRKTAQLFTRHRYPPDLEDFPTVYPDWLYHWLRFRGYWYGYPYRWWGGSWSPYW
ncbi:MAG: hypothetical protein FJZ01_14290 [Candidatus Sericytochromatia bacterium]|nr:hypothetical protein [Candidatus Tanganyikabacteria bacterium]